MPQTLARRIAEYAVNLKYEQLPDSTIHEVKRRVIDSLGTAVGAMPSEAYAIAKKCASRVNADPSATMLGGGSSSPEWACFVNGLLIRYLDFNDTYLSLEPAHPSDNLAPVFAVGEAVGATGQEMILAATIAYEIQCRFCDAASLRMHGVDHVTYGAISSAVAACKLMKLNVEQTTHAIGIAGVCNTALRQTRSGELSMWKGCAFANAARNGVFAATLCAEGYTGPSPIFEGDLGFFNLVSRAVFTPASFGGEADNSDGFMSGKTYIKFWPAEYHSQSAIDAALKLRAQIDNAVSLIDTLDIDTFEACYTIIGKYPEAWAPKTRETADHSLPYCTAAALLHGDVTLATFDDEQLRNPELLALTNKIQVHLDNALTPRYPKGIPNRLRATLSDGRVVVEEVEFPRGHAENPMSDAEVETKFRGLVEPRYGAETASDVLERCWDFDTLISARDLLEMLK